MATVLSSNIVNYVVWRYLQEAGFGNAALQLSRCWIRDPETLPFAANVEPHTLIRLLQDGMSFDQLQAEACNTEPRYRFGADHGRPYSARNGALLTLDKGIPAHELAAEANGGAVQEPPSKKGIKRKKQPKPPNGIESRPEPQVNGDAMEIEQNGATGMTNSVRAESEPIASEAESPTVAEIPMSTLSIGQDAEIQTEVITDLASSTTFIPGPRTADSLVEHTSWGSSDSPVLLTAGRSVLQVHLADKDAENEALVSVRTADVHLPVNNFVVTALCWHSHGEMTVSAREECFNEVGEKIMKDKLIKLVNGGTNCQVISSQAGLVNTLRWNDNKELLLSISNDGEKGSIKVWKNDSDPIPAWTEFTDKAIFDAMWISDSSFVVCGQELFKVYEVSESLTTQRTLDTNITWDVIKYDASSGIIAAMGSEGQKYYLGILHPNDSINLQTHLYPDEYPTDLDFRVRTAANTLTNGSSVPAVLLATSSMSGAVRVWDANEPFNCVKRLPTTDDTQAFKIAFSPDGTLLATAGPDAVTVWDVEKREVPVASWRAKSWTNDQWNPGINGEFSLGWHPSGSRLSIALGNQIAIISIPR